MPEVLDDAAVRHALSTLSGWSGGAGGIERTISAPDFTTGIRVVDRVAAAAEDMDHHPDIDVRWTDVTFRLSTHSAGGVTAADIELAARIDAIAAELSAG